jgi:hypothetical protein
MQLYGIFTPASVDGIWPWPAHGGVLILGFAVVFSDLQMCFRTAQASSPSPSSSPSSSLEPGE